MTKATLRRLCSAIVTLYGSLFVPGFVGNGLSQSWMTPAYSTYTSETNDATYIYTSVTVSGTTNGSCPTQPAYLANQCHSTMHTPKAYNVLGGVGGWQSGGSVYWNTWLSTANNQQIAFDPNSQYTFSYSSQVNCSFTGAAIYSLTGSL